MSAWCSTAASAVTNEDMPELVDIARAVHRVDGYPMFLPGDNYLRFLNRPTPLNAWVAVIDSVIVGHVALNASARRQHVGRQLLDHATDAARQAGLVAVLDVVSTSTAAINLYESAEWFQLGAVAFQLPDGRTVEEIVFAGRRPETDTSADWQ